MVPLTGHIQKRQTPTDGQVAAWPGWGGQWGGMAANGYRASWWGGENVLRLMVVGV